jgi:hypothetical protein
MAWDSNCLCEERERRGNLKGLLLPEEVRDRMTTLLRRKLYYAPVVSSRMAQDSPKIFLQAVQDVNESPLRGGVFDARIRI